MRGRQGTFDGCHSHNFSMYIYMCMQTSASGYKKWAKKKNAKIAKPAKSLRPTALFMCYRWWRSHIIYNTTVDKAYTLDDFVFAACFKRRSFSKVTTKRGPLIVAHDVCRSVAVCPSGRVSNTLIFFVLRPPRLITVLKYRNGFVGRHSRPNRIVIILERKNTRRTTRSEKNNSRLRCE